VALGTLAPGTLLRLLHLCDTLFPLGGFAYSDGLETATSSGEIHDSPSLSDWLNVVLTETFVRTDGPAVWRAWTLVHAEAWDSLGALDAEVAALRPSSTGRLSIRAMGQRLFGTWRELYPDARFDVVDSLRHRGIIVPTLPVAFAAVCVFNGTNQAQTAVAFAYTRLASTISAAMRLAPIGQRDAHQLLARTLERVPASVTAIAAADDLPSAFAPALDIAAMSQQYLHSRLFRS
jgi:urease accessory protein